jgi:hypothetical protein
VKELIEFIAKSLVDNPDAVTVTEVQGDKATVFELRVGKGGSWEGDRKAGTHGAIDANAPQRGGLPLRQTRGPGNTRIA